MPRAKNRPTGRRGGGQPGNKNALRHGFYSNLYTVKEGRELKDSVIEDELMLARHKLRRIAELTPLNHGDISQIEIALLQILNSLLISINTIERTRLLARGHGGQIGDDILTALREMNPYEDLE
jgi:hypothetical protein